MCAQEVAETATGTETKATVSTLNSAVAAATAAQSEMAGGVLFGCRFSGVVIGILIALSAVIRAAVIRAARCLPLKLN